MLVAFDGIVLFGATRLAAFIRFQTSAVEVDFETLSPSVPYDVLGILFVIASLVAFAFERLYDIERLEWGRGTSARILKGLCVGLVSFVLLAFVLKAPGISRAWLLLTVVLSAVLMVFARLVLIGVLARLRARGHFTRRTLIVGTNEEACGIARVFALRPELGLDTVGFLRTSADLSVDDGHLGLMPPVVGNARELVAKAQEYDVDTVVLASSAVEREVLARMISELRHAGVSLQVSAGLFEIHSSRISVSEMAGIPFMTVRGVSLARCNLVLKRACDLALSSLGILVGMPVWLVLAGLICVESRGPVFYRQTRVGQDGRLFRMYKFRSMCVDADAHLERLREHNEATGPIFKMKHDPRVTRVGKWMRRYSIDEFPQLINVFLGDMSLVGPRPPLPREAEEYSEAHWRRMEVPPGMTGLWQVSGRSALSFDDMVRLDVFYIENWSLGFDLEILARTVPVVFWARGAY